VSIRPTLDVPFIAVPLAGFETACLLFAGFETACLLFAGFEIACLLFAGFDTACLLFAGFETACLLFAGFDTTRSGYSTHRLGRRPRTFVFDVVRHRQMSEKTIAMACVTLMRKVLLPHPVQR
jgi:hypothetical protein